MFISKKKSLKSDVIHSLIIKACNLMPDIEEWNLRLQENFNKIPSFKESIINIHNPLEEDYLSNSSTYMTRLAYDEIFAYQLSLAVHIFEAVSLNFLYIRVAFQLSMYLL